MSDEESGFGTGSGYTISQSANISLGDVSAPEASAPQAVKDISTAEFMAEVVEASSVTPVLIDFWAPWCGPCKQLAPALEKVVAETNGAVKLVKMNIDEHPEVAGQMGIQSIPAVVAFVDGKPADAFMGAKPESEIRAFVEKFGSSDESDGLEQAFEAAEALIAENAYAEAANIYANILAQDPANLRALSGLGHLYVRENNIEAAKGLVSQLTDEQLADDTVSALVAAIDLAEKAERIGDFSELEVALEKNPDDHSIRMDLAIALNGANQREEAADHLLEIIKTAPEWNEDAARKQLLEFFETWGMTDENTVSARRKLSSLLFS